MGDHALAHPANLDIERADWSLDERALWRRIEAHRFERDDQPLDFTQRLARDRGWSLDFARGAVAEYRRFCFLAIVSATPVTPSEEVDEVWHQHLVYSHDYWEIWCGTVLGRPLHHDPTAGGPAEQARYRAQYAETLARYEAYFGPPDPLFWPGTQQRFRGRPRYRIVDEDRVMLLPRPRFPAWFGRVVATLALVPAAPRPAQALPLNPLDWTAGPFLTLYVVLGLATCLFAWARRRRPMAVATSGTPDDLGLLDLAMLGGGRERAADTVIVGWLKHGAARIENSRGFLGVSEQKIAVDDRTATLPRDWEPMRGAFQGLHTRASLVSDLKSRLGGIEASLARRGLMPDAAALRSLNGETLITFLPILTLSVAKLFVGLARDKPVGILVFCLIALVFVAAVMIFKPPLRTGQGEAALARYRARYRRATDSPRDHELLFAFALVGSPVLTGTALADYGRMMQSSGGSDGGSSGDGGGSGCGGGGCGGCGS